MSLFQLQEWWRCSRTESGEECGTGCLCIANIDNSSNELDKIIVGSYNGIIHIYSPLKGSANMHDCFLEAKLNYPILQINAGRFVPLNTDIHLAVLHPRLLSIYKFVTVPGQNETSMKMETIYQHKLDRSAANIVVGPFGGVKDRDFLCVQSLDGALAVFEQETLAFTRFLPGFLLPGPLAYIAHTDSFITATSSCAIEAYSYQVVAVAADVAQVNEEDGGKQTGKKIDTDWSFNTGEYILSLEVIDFPQKKPLIVALGEHSLFCIDTSGNLEYIIKFDEPWSCAVSFPSPTEWKPITIGCTFSKQMYVYEGQSMKWAARCDDEPIDVKIGTFCVCRGMLIFLNDNCDVSVNFLGTAPTVFALPRSKRRNLSLSKADNELLNTNKLIAEHLASSGDEMASKNVKENLTLSFHVPKTLDKTSAAKQRMGVANELPSITVQILLKVSRRINEVQISIPIDKPLCTTLSHHQIPSIHDPDHPTALISTFFLDAGSPPSSLKQRVIVNYKQISGEPEVVIGSLRLPLCLVASPSQPVKKMEYKVTFETNISCVNLLELFPDFAASYNTPHQVGLAYLNGIKVTVITSKTSNRYRVQSDEYDALWLVSNELVHQLRGKHSNIDISYADPPNLEDYFQCIDEHFRLRNAMIGLRQEAEQRAVQYRIIQRRLLTRYKDKTPHPLLGLDTLLTGTHTQLLAIIDSLEENDKLLRKSSVKLSSASELLALLTSLWRNMTVDEKERLRGVLAVELTYSESGGVGWEEMVDCAISSLLKTILARAEGDSLVPAPPHSLEPMQDTDKLKKHIATLLERLGKGGKLISFDEKSTKQAKSRKTLDNSTLDFKLNLGSSTEIAKVKGLAAYSIAEEDETKSSSRTSLGQYLMESERKEARAISESPFFDS